MSYSNAKSAALKDKLKDHHRKKHPGTPCEDEAIQCCVRGIKSFWLDKHMKQVHKYMIVFI